MKRPVMVHLIFPVCLLFCVCISPVYAQVDSGDDELSASDIARLKYDEAWQLYQKGDYETSRDKVNISILEFEQQKIYYPKSTKANFYVLKAMLLYVFREEGYRDEIDALFLKAITIHLGQEIGDATQVPPFLIERFNKIKRDYLAQYSKLSRRFSMGLVTTLICTENFSTQNIQPGIHYAFNLSDYLSLTADIKFPIRGGFWDFWRIKGGIIWYPSFKVEDLVFGIGFYDIFTINSWKVVRNSFSIAGHGEIITRSGLGIAADIELLRFDLIFTHDLEGAQIENFSPMIIANSINLFFAHLDFYLVIAV